MLMAKSITSADEQIRLCAFICGYLEKENDYKIKLQVVDALVEAESISSALLALIHLKSNDKAVVALNRFVAAACNCSVQARTAVKVGGGLTTLRNIARFLEEHGSLEAQSSCTKALQAAVRNPLGDRLADPREADRQRQADITAGLFGD